MTRHKRGTLMWSLYGEYPCDRWRIIVMGDFEGDHVVKFEMPFSSEDEALAVFDIIHKFDDRKGNVAFIYDAARIVRPAGWLPPGPTRLPIYGERPIDLALREIRHDERFGWWLTAARQARRFDDLKDAIDSQEDPATVTIEEATAVVRRLNPGDWGRKHREDITDQLEEAIERWLPRALRLRGFDPNARLHTCHEVVTGLTWPEVPGVYFVRAHDRVKIGKAKNVRVRLTELQTSSPFALELLAIAPGGLAEEASLHRRFRHLRRQGEWFELAPELMTAITDLRMEVGSRG